MDTKDYIKIFEQSSESLVVIDTTFAILAVSDAFLKATATVRENIVGHDIFDVFSDNPDDKTANGENIVRTSFNRVIKNKTADTLPVIRYDIPKPASEGGGFETKYWKVVNSPILDDNKNVKYIIQRSEDLIENETVVAQLDAEHKALKQLEDSEKRYNMMLMKSPFGFAIFKGKNMVISLANDSIKTFWGKGKDVEGKPLFDVIPELKDSAFPGLLDKVYTTGIPFYGDELFAPMLRNGAQEDVYFNFVYQPYLEADETISGVTIIAYEVTAAVIVKKALEAQRKAEQIALKKIEETNKRYYTMLMESPFAFSVMKGKDMVITLANDLIKEFWGKGNEVEGKTLLQILPELKDQPFPEMIEKVYTTGISVYANEILGKLTYDGQIKHKYFNVVFQPYYEADNSISGVMQIAYDVTEMVLARRKIQESKEQFQAAIAAGEGILWTNNAKGEMEGEQLGWVLLTGQTYEEYQGYGWTNAVHPDDTQPTIDGWNEAVKERKIFIFEHRVKRKDGQWRNFSIRAIPLLNADGSLRQWVGVHTDITEKKQQQQILAENEQRLRLATQTSGVGIWEWNVITNKIRWDAQMFHIYGVIPTADGFVEYSTWSNAVVPEDLTDQERILQDTVRNIGSSKRSFKIIRASDGMLSDIETIETVRTNAEGNAEWVLGTNLDVTEKVLARKKIEESEKRYNMMLMHSPFTFAVLKGKDLVIDLANDRIKEVWGLGNDIEGKSLLEIMPDLKNTTFPALLDEVRATGIPFHGIEVQSPKSLHGDLREEYFFNFVFQPYLEADETISGITIIGNDVTEQVIAKRKIKESEQRFEIAVAAVEGILWTNNAKGEMVGEQPGWASLTGQSYEEYQGFGWSKAIHPDDAQPTIDAWNQAVSEGKNFIFEHSIRLKNGNWGNFSVRAIPSLNFEGLIQEWIGVHTDITQQRQTEKALQNAIHEQEEAKRKAEAAQLVAEEAMQAKQQFLSNMSHEIRTPMNAIIGFTNVLLKTKLEKTQEEYLTAIKVSGDALLVLINDILDLAKVDAGRMTFEQIPFNLATSLSAMLQLFEIKIKEKNLELVEQLDTAIPEIILGDPIRLRQIILNLVSNAVKFTEVGKITMRVALLKQNAEEATLEFTVTDTGIGIHKNKLEHIFDDFGQATYENSRLYGGTGLGLTIVRKLIEQQGGTIHVESELAKGSTFSFQLSFAKTNQKIKRETERVSNKQAEIKNLNILVAEDMPLNQLLIKIILADFGFEVDIAENGKIAIEKLQQKKYDLVLMDLQMPEMNGFDATAYVRNTMKSNIPIIALTADVTSIDVEKARAVGMNDYISKPVDEQLLYSKIIKVLQKTD